MLTILLVSPEPWLHVPVSKHHYARTLAEEGHEVIFLDPPDKSSRSLEVIPTEHKGIRRMAYPYPYYHPLRFHFRTIHDFLEGGAIRKIVRAIGGPLDLVWSFDFNRFRDLRLFGAKSVIFHPMDPGSSLKRSGAGSADIIFAVSEAILDPFRVFNKPCRVIPHGVSPPFERLARESIPWQPGNGPFKMGYAGNLSRPMMACDVINSLVQEFPDVEFHFWGETDPPWELEPHIKGMIETLKRLPNCVIHGVVPPDRLAVEMCGMDCFLLAYNNKWAQYDLSNAHKILEYMSTGRVTLSSPLTAYAGRLTDEVIFVKENTAESFVANFRTLRERIHELNDGGLQQKRRQLALENTYLNHWRTIETCLKGIGKA